MPADQPSADTKRERTPEPVGWAVDIGRRLLEDAEEYHTAVYLSPPLRDMVLPVSPISAKVELIMVENPTIVKMHNFPLIPVPPETNAWKHQAPWISATAKVTIACIVKNRPALSSSPFKSLWKITAAGTAAMRAAAWDYLQWVPSENIIRVTVGASLRVVNEGMGKTICQTLTTDWIGATDGYVDGILGQLYLTWRLAFVLGYKMIGHMEADCLDMARQLIPFLTPTATRFAAISMLINSSHALMVLCQAALTAVPREMWASVDRSLVDGTA